MKTVRTNFDHRDLPSHVFSKNRIPADLQQFMRKRIIPKLKLRGYKLAEKRSIAMQAIHNLLMAWSVGACVRDTRNVRLRGVQLRVGVWDAIVNAGFATKCLGSESSGKQTRYRATEKLRALRSCWDLRLTVGSDLKRNTELSKPTWKALVVLHSGRFDLATGKRLPDGARKRLISIPDYIATTVQRNRVVVRVAESQMKTDKTDTKSVLTKKLLEIACESANLETSEVLEYLQAPDWDASKGWEWELYVPRNLREFWSALNQESQLVAFLSAISRISDGRIRSEP